MERLAQVTLLVFLIVCCGFTESRLLRRDPGSPVSHRKPPFNGSIFGKRSVIRPDFELKYNGFGRGPVAGELSGSPSSVLDTIDLGTHQDELLVSALRQCLDHAQTIETDPVKNMMCASFLDELKNSRIQQSLTNEGWALMSGEQQ